MYTTGYFLCCDRCQRGNFKLQKPAGPLHPIPVSAKIWKQVGMDLIGPLTETPREIDIITLTDYFTKWAEAGALPDKKLTGRGKVCVLGTCYSLSIFCI